MKPAPVKWPVASAPNPLSHECPPDPEQAPVLAPLSDAPYQHFRLSGRFVRMPMAKSAVYAIGDTCYQIRATTGDHCFHASVYAPAAPNNETDLAHYCLQAVHTLIDTQTWHHGRHHEFRYDPTEGLQQIH